jgi:gliding motility-associated-like protein
MSLTVPMKASAFFIIALVACLSVQAQLCTGSLGDPVVHITFGAGSGPGPALAPGKTSYNYVTSPCPNDGEYSLVDITFNCFSGSWHTLVGDHTPNDALGKYMLINASFTPGDFYVDTIYGLCPNTNYEFATWVRNILKPSACNSAGIKPNLTFKIETLTGTMLATFNSGDIDAADAPEWKQYGTFFQTPVGVTNVVIRLTNNAAGGCGNDLALDDITFRPCGPRVTATVGTTGSSEFFACESDNRVIQLNASYSTGVYSNPSFQWQESFDNGTTWTSIPGATGNTYTRPASVKGNYWYRMLIADGASNINVVSCRIASNTISVTVSQPVAQAVNYVFGCYGSTIAFYAAGGSTYNWVGPNGWSSNVQGPVLPNVQFTDAGWYKVKVTDFMGCSDEDSTNLVIYPAATAVAGPDVTICEGRSTTLTASGGTRYYWQPVRDLSLDTIPNPVASPKETTVYNVIVFNEYGCYDTASTKVTVWKKPQANAGTDKKMRLGLPVIIEGTVSGSDIRYYWTPASTIADPNKLRTSVNPTTSTTYTLHAESLNGCGTHTDDVFVRVYEKIVVPNAFSPNGDGINDTWIIEPLDLFEDSKTTIYNRYGQEVYSSNGYSRPWDGTRLGRPVPVGTYYYVIDLKIPREPLITGSVTIIR